MVIPMRVTTRDLLRRLEKKTGRPESELREILDDVFGSVRELLDQGSEVELADLLSLTVHGGPEIREDESREFSAFAATHRSLSATPIGSLKTQLDRASEAAIFYVSRSNGDFEGLLADHFGRRGWPLIRVQGGREVLARLDRNPAAAVIFESHVDGWQELVRELTCNPRTNQVPLIGVFPSSARDDPVERLLVMPDEVVYEPFDFSEFIDTASAILADRVVTLRRDVIELQMQMPGTRKARRASRAMLREVLFRCDLSERFNEDACTAFAEALDNAVRHGHQHVECCTIDVRVILDPKRLMLVVRDTGDGFDHLSMLDAARSPVVRNAGLSSAAAQLRTRKGEAGTGGIARMIDLVDRLEYNRKGNEAVLTLYRPTPLNQAQ